jgi:hypothetical protein
LTVLAFTRGQAQKDDYLARVAKVRAEGQLVEFGMVEAILDNGDYDKFPYHLGIPEVLAYAAVALFCELTGEVQQAWPERFLSAIAPGTDLSAVWPKFALWILGGLLGETWPSGLERERAAVQEVAELLANGTKEDLRATASRCRDGWKSAPIGPAYSNAFAALVSAEQIAQIALDYQDDHPYEPWFGAPGWAGKVVEATANEMGAGWTSTACDALIRLLEAAPTAV